MNANNFGSGEVDMDGVESYNMDSANIDKTVETQNLDSENGTVEAIKNN